MLRSAAGGPGGRLPPAASPAAAAPPAAQAAAVRGCAQGAYASFSAAAASAARLARTPTMRAFIRSTRSLPYALSFCREGAVRRQEGQQAREK